MLGAWSRSSTSSTRSASRRCPRSRPRRRCPRTRSPSMIDVRVRVDLPVRVRARSPGDVLVREAIEVGERRGSNLHLDRARARRLADLPPGREDRRRDLAGRGRRDLEVVLVPVGERLPRVLLVGIRPGVRVGPGGAPGNVGAARRPAGRLRLVHLVEVVRAVVDELCQVVVEARLGGLERLLAPHGRRRPRLLVR